MRGLFLSVFVVSLAACGGGGGGSAPINNPPPPVGTGGYTSSEPLVDNTGATAYKILLMGNSHAAGLAPILEQLLLLGQTKPIDV